VRIGKIFLSRRFHICFLFVKLSATLSTHVTKRGKPCCLVKPALKNGVPTQMAGLASEEDEYHLSDFFSVRRNSRVPERDGIHQIDMPLHQSGKSLFRPSPGVILQQLYVAHVCHLHDYYRRMRNQTILGGYSRTLEHINQAQRLQPRRVPHKVSAPLTLSSARTPGAVLVRGQPGLHFWKDRMGKWRDRAEALHAGNRTRTAKAFATDGTPSLWLRI
jgi:hypothetical protein